MSNLIEHAKKEFEILGWNEDVDEMQQLICKNIIEMLETLSNQGHSGSTHPYLMDLFTKLANFEIISPLTGEDDEWQDVSESSGYPMWQNKRFFSIFKTKKNNSDAHWVDGKVFRDPNGSCYTNGESRIPVSFPWVKPKTIYIDVDE